MGHPLSRMEENFDDVPCGHITPLLWSGSDSDGLGFMGHDWGFSDRCFSLHTIKSNWAALYPVDSNALISKLAS